MERRESASVVIVSVRLVVLSATDVVVVGFGHRVESRNRPANSSQGGFLISNDRAPSNGDPALPTMWRWNFKAEQKKPPKRDHFFSNGRCGMGRTGRPLWVCCHIQSVGGVGMQWM